MKFITTLDLNKNELQNAVIQNLGSDPSNPKTGQVYYNTSDKVMYQYDGSEWKSVGADPSGTYLPLSGGTMTGSIAMASGAGTNAITNVTDPSNAQDAATKAYVDKYKVGSASFADDTSNDSSNPVKLTIKDSQSTAANLATANIPAVSSSSAGVAPKGASVTTQSQSTKFLREDGTWAAPSYTDISSLPDHLVNGAIVWRYE